MNFFKSLKNDVLNVTEDTFESVAIRVFKHQVTNNSVYQEFVHFLDRDIDAIDSISKIPFLPIEFFKSRKVVDNESVFEAVYESSATTGDVTSKHYIHDKHWYLRTALKGFEDEYGRINAYHILALLPSYLERENSSLVAMVDFFIEKSNSHHSGFYLNELELLVAKINELKKMNRKVLLIGVSFALLELAELYSLDLSDVIIMETGGMKGRRKELTRPELHAEFTKSFNVSQVHSEYGMTELLSQAYSKGRGIFKCPPWMRVLIRDVNDPFEMQKKEKVGGMNIIDLINIHSCSFIETKDLGREYADGDFEVLGRFDNSDIRGCNLMVL